MKYNIFQEMKVLDDEVRKGIIYRGSTGFYNFQRLKGLLIKEDLITPYHEKIFSNLEKQVGLDKKFEREMGEYLRILSRIKTSDRMRLIIEKRLRDQLRNKIMPKYEEFEVWYKGERLLRSKRKDEPIKLSDGWKIIYCTDFQSLQLIKETRNGFISVIGPGLKYNESKPKQVFELYVAIGESGFGDTYERYPKVLSEVREKCLEELPLESEIERAIKSIEPITSKK